MITFYDKHGTKDEGLAVSGLDALPDGTIWIDLFNETEAESDFVERIGGVKLPSASRIAEIETSSRQSVEGETLQMSSPILFRDHDRVETTPVGFVLKPDLLITLRSKNLKAFVEFSARHCSKTAVPPGTSIDVLLGLIDAIVDRMADGMESVGADLDRVSRRIFDAHANGGGRASKVESDLQSMLQTIGRSGDTTSQARDSLLGLARMMAFVAVNTHKRIAPEAVGQLDSLRQDITSLNEYETHLTNKVQFMLDSTLGFINIEQNRTFKLLTVISVIGIPPTFVVGLYGMNFKNMPEYDWTYGYQWGLAVVLVSVIVPVIWLRLKGWF